MSFASQPLNVAPGEHNVLEMIRSMEADPASKDVLDAGVPTQFRTQIKNATDIKSAQPDADAPAVGDQAPPAAPATVSSSDAPALSPPPPTVELDSRVTILEAELARAKSKYDSEVPRLRQAAEKSERQTQVYLKALDQSADLSRLAVEKAAKAAAPTPASEDPRDRYGLTDEELDIGSEQLALTQKITRREIELAIQSGVESRLSKIESILTKRMDVSFQTELSTTGYPSLQDDPDFREFLTRTDPMRGESYASMLDAAKAEMNAPRVKAIVDHYKAVSGIPDSPAPTEPVASPPLPPASPSSTGAPAVIPPPQPPRASGKKIYTLSEAHELLKNVGKLSPNKQAELFAELDQAKAEGRISG